MASGAKLVTINGRQVRLTNLEKVLWPGAGYTKAALLKYLISVYPYLGPHLFQRPLVVTRWPTGIGGKSFYQKNAPAHTPDWVETFSWKTSRGGRTINYILCNNLETLVWLGNQACLEYHPWLSSVHNINNPDFLVFDLDPSRAGSSAAVGEIALTLRDILAKLGLEGYPKTSGATGMHIYVPLEAVYPYGTVRETAAFIASLVVAALPQIATITRSVGEREGKVYIDYLQNVRGQTICSPYSPRPLPGAPVSMPLIWEEVANFSPQSYNIETAIGRLKEVGDLFAPVLKNRQSLKPVLNYLARRGTL
ncbi:MAG: non-homologous end-joining DNA ligase [bacterium]|jgi:bifunctional non-homologous end joining protein LigD|nr:non-homologous end-joining DNA ligase [Bacillota bacterium]